VFWIGFFGVAFIVVGLSTSFNFLQTPGVIGLGLIFAIWVLTVHLLRVLGLYGIPGAGHNPKAWESLFIAMALW